MSLQYWAGRQDIIGHLTPIGPVDVFGTGGFGFGAYGWSSPPSGSRLYLGNDGLVHVLDMYLNHALYNEIWYYHTQLVDYSCTPSLACEEPSQWYPRYSPYITRDPSFPISGLGGIVYGLTVSRHTDGPWITMVDWWMGNTSLVGYASRITVDFSSGLSRPVCYSGTNVRADAAFGVPVVTKDGQRYYVTRGCPATPSWAYYGPAYFGYFQLDAQGNILRDVHVQTGYYNGWNPMTGYVVNLISAWARGDSLEFAVWEQDDASLMHIYRVDHPSLGEGWHEVGNVHMTAGVSIDSLRIMDDGTLCMVLSTGGAKHLLWWDGVAFEEDYLGLTTSTDDVNFYQSFFGGDDIGQLRIFAGTKNNCKGVFGFRYQQSDNPYRLHLGIKVATIKGMTCTTKTLYHTVFPLTNLQDDNGWALAYPSILKLPNGKTLFCFAAANPNISDGVYTDCIVESGAQSNAIWYGE
jgi:hypothetical protein